jgi:hypothetical protein
VLHGSFGVDQQGEYDGVCIFAAERHVVYITSKLSETHLLKEVEGVGELPLPSAAGSLTCRRAHTHGLNLIQALESVISPTDAASADVRELVEIVADPTTASYVFVTCDLTEHGASTFLNRIPACARADVWVTDLNQLLSFPARKLKETIESVESGTHSSTPKAVDMRVVGICGVLILTAMWLFRRKT